jgi:hypothetical protein
LSEADGQAEPDAPDAAAKPRRARATPTAADPAPETASAAADAPLQQARHAAELAHHAPGRVRLKLAAARNNPALLNQIRDAFAAIPGVDAVIVKAATGSLVIHYDPEHHPDLASLFTSLDGSAAPAALPMASAVQAGSAQASKPRIPATDLDKKIDAIEQEAEYLAEHSHLARSIVDGVKALDRGIKRSTNNTVDLKILTPLGLAALTFIEIGAAAATPMWVTLAIFSLNHFVELRAHDDGEPAPSDVAAEPT